MRAVALPDKKSQSEGSNRNTNPKSMKPHFMLTDRLLRNYAMFFAATVIGLTVLGRPGPVQATKLAPYFREGALRVDFELSGDSRHTEVFFVALKEEPHWGGPVKNLIDRFDYGNFRFRLFDLEEGKLLFSSGFSTLFEEWQVTEEAALLKRSFYQAIRTPFPNKPMRLVLERRDRDTGRFHLLADREIDPDHYAIVREAPHQCRIHRLRSGGTPSESLDIAVISEGYRANEMPKFRKDVARITEHLLGQDPFSRFADQINVYALEAHSQQSGTDVPAEGRFRNTALSSSYSTFGIDRYLTLNDPRAMFDIAANVPYDHILVLVNADSYGGGGFYNYYAIGTADHPLSAIVGVHELGHSIGGLGDEYYESEVTFSEFYNPLVEPWEPNLSSGVDFERKWHRLIEHGTPLPTPRSSRYANQVGMFEGGGYLGSGMYSPAMDCRMKSNEAENFCPVCTNALIARLAHYADREISPPGYLTTTVPPPELGLHPFFTKYLNAGGLPIVGSQMVPDEAFIRARQTLLTMCSLRPELLRQSGEMGIMVAVLGYGEGIGKLPGFPAADAGQPDPDVFIRSMPATPDWPFIVCAEENLLAWNQDRHRGEDMLIRSFAASMLSMILPGSDPAAIIKISEICELAVRGSNCLPGSGSPNIDAYWSSAVQLWFEVHPYKAATLYTPCPVRGQRLIGECDPQLYELLSGYFPALWGDLSLTSIKH